MILFYLDDTRLTDEQRGLLALIRSLDVKRFPYRVLALSYEGEMAEALKRSGITFDAIPLPETLWTTTGASFFSRVKRMSLGLVALAAYYRKLYRYYKMYPFDVVHAGGMVANLLSIGLKMRFNTPLIWQLWTVFPNGPRVFAFQWAVSVFCDHVVACSQSAAHCMGRHIRWRDRVVVAYRGYDASEFKLVPRGAMPRLSVATVGRLFQWKGHKTLLRAMELVRRQSADFRATIYVTRADDLRSPYHEELTRLIQELKLEDAVRFECLEKGFDDGVVARALRSGNIGLFLDPSVEPDAFESALAEAMAERVPVIVSRVGVLSEMILHETTGLLVTPGDANVLAQTILKLAGDESLCQQITAAARAEFESRFGVERSRQTVEILYAQFVEEQKSDEVVSDNATKKAA